jgi:hypothetical protein
MAENTGNVIHVPSQSSVAEVKPGEIIASYARFTQKGITLEAGQVLAAGTVMGKVTASKKYAAYNNSNSDGTEVARGVLRQDVDTSDGERQGNLVVSGILKLDQITGSDANALTDLNAREDSENNLYIF